MQPRIVGLVVAVTILWGLNWPAMKTVVGQVDPWTFRIACVYGAGMTLLVIARLQGENVRPVGREWVHVALVSLFSVTGWHMLTAYGLGIVGGGRAAILAFTMPLWATIISHFVLSEPLGVRQFMALGSGMLGIGAMLMESFTALGNAPVGTALILAAAVCWAIGTVGVKATPWSIGTIALSGWLMLIGGVPIALAWLLTSAPGDLTKVTTVGFAAWAYVIFVALVFCFTSFLRIVRSVPASVAATSTLAIPVVGVVSSAVLLGEPVGLTDGVALLLVCGAVALVLWPARRQTGD